LEESIKICPTQTCESLKHVCWSRGDGEAIKILEFMVEKIAECTMTKGDINIEYRPYFKAISEIILDKSINDTQMAFIAVIPTLIAKVIYVYLLLLLFMYILLVYMYILLLY
jgi:hypothetical protein